MKFYKCMGSINASYMIPNFVFITEKSNNQNWSQSVFPDMKTNSFTS